MEFNVILFKLLKKEKIRISDIEDMANKVIKIIKETQDNVT